MMQQERYKVKVKQRLSRLEEETLQDNLIVLNKFREEYAHLIHPFRQEEWTEQCIPDFSSQNPLQKIIKAQCIKINFDKIAQRFLFVVNIPKSLSFIIFPKLAELRLNNNFISSIQSFCQLRAPLLQYLYLNENLITNIRALRKCNFPQIQTIDLRTNPIPNFDCISEMDLYGLIYLKLRADSNQNRRQWYQSHFEMAYEQMPSVLTHPNPDMNFLFKNKAVAKQKCLFLYECEPKANSRKRQIFRQRSLRT